MTAPRLHRFLITAALATAGLTAQAASLVTSGHLVFDTDVVRIDFSVAAAGPVTIWTDSWQAGLNFDPTLSLFDASGSLIVTGDDTPDLTTAHAGQGGYDSQISVATLAPGHYLLSLSASGNDPVGTSFADGFSLQGTTPIPIAEWNQPSYDINRNDQKGTFWEVRADGVSALTAVPAVPEPGEWALLLAGLVGGVARLRGKSARS